MFDVCTAGDTAHIDTIFWLLPHTHASIGVLAACTDTQFQ
jgi:endoglucanase Acf2